MKNNYGCKALFPSMLCEHEEGEVPQQQLPQGRGGDNEVSAALNC